MSYINIFGGYTINPAFVSYLNLNSAIFTANLTLSWPSQYQDTQYVVASTIDLQPAGAGLSITMPDATQTSTAQYVVFNNYGANAVTIYANDGVTAITTINAGNVFYVYLINNTTTNGTWRTIPFGTGGGGVVTSIAAVSTTTPALTITGSPVTSSGTFSFTIDTDLVALDSFGAGTGIAARTGVGTWALRSLTNGSGIIITNPGGVAGNPQIAVNTNLVLTNLTVGNLNLTGNTFSSTVGAININPVALASVTLGSNATPVGIDSSNNVSNVNTLTATTVNVGNLSMLVNTISAVIGGINIFPAALASVYLGSNATPITISSTNIIRNVASLAVGNLFLTSNSVTSTVGAVNITPVALANVTLGSNGTPVVVDPSNNLYNINNITASNLIATAGLITNYNNSPIARIWIVWNAVTKTVLNSFNLLTATYNGTGSYTFGFNTIPANYLVLTTSDQVSGGLTVASTVTYTTTSITISVVNSSNTPVDPAHLHIAIFY